MGLEVEVVGDTNKFDVIVIGGGVAGITASCAVTEAGLKSCFLEKDVPGGKLMQLQKVHNFPPMPDIEGPALGRSFFNHAIEETKTSYSFGLVKYIKPRNDLFYLFTDDGQTFEAKAIIICTGTINKKLHIPGEMDYYTKGLSYCVLCDGALTQDKKVVLIGESTHLDFLKQYASDVVVLKANEAKEILGDGNKVTGVLKTDGTKVDCQYVFVENGFETSTNFLPPEIKLSETKEVIVDDNQATNFKGVYAAGDCTNSKIKMILPAIEQANKAAANAVEYIKSRRW